MPPPNFCDRGLEKTGGVCDASGGGGWGVKRDDYNGKVMRAISVHYG